MTKVEELTEYNKPNILVPGNISAREQMPI
jgi:hypothetical protein